jgi:hypothetical protein
MWDGTYIPAACKIGTQDSIMFVVFRIYITTRISSSPIRDVFSTLPHSRMHMCNDDLLVGNCFVSTVKHGLNPNSWNHSANQPQWRPLPPYTPILRY